MHKSHKTKLKAVTNKPYTDYEFWGNLTVKTLIIKTVGSRCNLACTYCDQHQNSHNMPDMSVDTIIPFLDTCNAAQVVNVVMHGGEPLLYGLENTKHLLAEIHSRLQNKYFFQTLLSG
jgi:sulfatase maturation enzyme AslB (radical SAM superfamily)